MTLYQDLGSRGPIYGISDSTQQINPYLLGTGWDVIADPTVIATSLTRVELYHVAIDGPWGSSLALMRNGKVWEYVNQAFKNGFDPNEPMPIGQTDTVAFAWNFPFAAGPYNTTTNVQPTVTLWLRQRVSP